jgi:hypothetical protein
MASCRRYLELALVLAVASSARAQLIAPAEDAPVDAAFRVSGLLQVDGTAFDQTSADELDPATREPLNRDRITVQRAWLRADASSKYVHGLVLLEGTTNPAPGVRLLAAELARSIPATSNR